MDADDQVVALDVVRLDPNRSARYPGEVAVIGEVIGALMELDDADDIEGELQWPWPKSWPSMHRNGTHAHTTTSTSYPSRR